jgi:hypothetical protein
MILSRKVFFKAFFLSIFFVQEMFSQELIWAKSTKQVLKLAEMDIDHNLISVGSFNNETDLNWGADTFHLNTEGGRTTYISKSTTNSELIWAKNIGGEQSPILMNDLCVDLQNNIYLSGTFLGSIDVDPGPGTHLLSSTNALTTFILKLNSSGNFVWAKTIGSEHLGALPIIAVDQSNSIYLAGSIENINDESAITTDLNPGVGTYNISIPIGTTLNFLIKLNPEGELLWEKHFANGLINGIAIDSDNNIAFSGSAQAGVSIDNSNSTLTPYNSGFVCCLNSDGTFRWFYSIPDLTIQKLKFDSNNHIHIAGNAELPNNFAPSETEGYFVDGTSTHSFLLQLDQQGAFIRVGIFDNTISLNEIDFDDFGNKLLIGNIKLANDFDFTDSVHIVTTAYITNTPDIHNSNNMFIAKYSAFNELHWAHPFGSVNADSYVYYDDGLRIFITDNSTMLIAGVTTLESDFDFQEGVYMLPIDYASTTDPLIAYQPDSYLAKYQLIDSGIEFDFNNDGTVNQPDLLLLLAYIGCSNCTGYDIDNNGIVTMQDVMIMMALIQ